MSEVSAFVRKKQQDQKFKGIFSYVANTSLPELHEMLSYKRRKEEEEERGRLEGRGGSGREAWSFVSDRSLIISPRDPCLYVMLFPVAEGGRGASYEI